MIYTVTLNPALDYFMQVEDFRADTLNRSAREKICPGGKGINVSHVLKNLGVRNIALGFLAGETGNMVQRMMEQEGIVSSFLFCASGITRINVKIKSEHETEINGNGPAVSEEEMYKLFKKLEKLEEGDYLVLAGNVPGNLPDSTYKEILHRLSDKKINFVVDATGECLKNVLEYHPFLIKPNHHELGELFQAKVETHEQAALYAKMLQQIGARNVLVSMGAQGAVLVDEAQNVYFADAPDGEVCNTIGSGDSMVAGFLAGYIESQDFAEAMRMGLCAGSASAFKQDLATLEEVTLLMRENPNLVKKV